MNYHLPDSMADVKSNGEPSRSDSLDYCLCGHDCTGTGFSGTGCIILNWPGFLPEGSEIQPVQTPP